MEGEYQVCELEETVYNAFDRFTVSVVPEIWIARRDDGSLACYWPKKNAEKKIRKRQPPEEGGTYYKCRILFDGAKFSTFKKAKAAEIVAQNYSIMDCSAVAHQDKLNSTMHFDISAVPDIRDDNDNDNDCVNGFVVKQVDDDNEDQFIGNDTTEFNQLMLRKPIVFKVTDLDDCDKNLPSVAALPPYDALFKTTNEFLTSTALDDSGSAFSVDGTSCLGDENMDHFEDAQIKTLDDIMLSKISSIESKISSLIKSMQDVKEMIQRRATERDRDDASVNRVHVLSVETIKMPVETSENVSHERIWRNTLNETFAVPSHNVVDISERQNLEVYFDQADGHLMSLNPEDSNVHEAIEQSRPIVIQSNLVNDQYDQDIQLVDGNTDGSRKRENVLQTDVDLVEYQNDVVLIQEIPKTSDDQNSKQHPTCVALPVDTIPEYQHNEDILELEDGAISDLVERMKPLNEEGETEYMNRIVFVAFTTDFLLKHISWKAENDRVNLKHGNFLRCWKESYEEKFGPDEKNERVQQHIRRLKATKRAAVKRLTARNTQPKKQNRK